MNKFIQMGFLSGMMEKDAGGWDFAKNLPFTWGPKKIGKKIGNLIYDPHKAEIEPLSVYYNAKKNPNYKIPEGALPSKMWNPGEYANMYAHKFQGMGEHMVNKMLDTAQEKVKGVLNTAQEKAMQLGQTAQSKAMPYLMAMMVGQPLLGSFFNRMFGYPQQQVQQNYQYPPQQPQYRTTAQRFRRY